MSDASVNLSRSGPPETILAAEPAERLLALEHAMALEGEDRRAALVAVISQAPDSLFGWASLGEASDDLIETYAYFRVGYHRGLDRLRQSGWRGSGFVRWQHPSNRGFLRSLAGLAASADAIDESEEAKRCALFLQQLDPDWPPSRS